MSDPWNQADDAFLTAKTNAASTEEQLKTKPVAAPKQEAKKPKKGKKKGDKKVFEVVDTKPEADEEMKDERYEFVPSTKVTKGEGSTYIHSEEPGFTGKPEEWFDDKQFKSQLIKDMEYDPKQDYYFGSYSHFNIHEEMIKDRVRTESYQAAIESNRANFKDKVVLDIGCGTGILSLFAARAGAKHVIGVDNAEIADYAKEIVKRNGYEDKVTILKGKMEEVELPFPKVDIIISEWMGYFLLYEAMLDSVLWARDKYLVKGGTILPDKCSMHVAAIEDADYKKEKQTFWNDIYGFDMSCLTPAVMVEPLVDTINPRVIASTVNKFYEFDINTVTKEELDFSAQYAITMSRKDRIHGVVTWFDIEFGNLDNVIKFSTGPQAEYTHWKQTIFYFPGQYNVHPGDKIEGSIASRKSRSNFRELDIKISYHFTKFDSNDKRSSYGLYKLR